MGPTGTGSNQVVEGLEFQAENFELSPLGDSESVHVKEEETQGT